MAQVVQAVEVFGIVLVGSVLAGGLAALLIVVPLTLRERRRVFRDLRKW